MAPPREDDPAAVRAVIDSQIKYLGQQITRIDDDHAGIKAQLVELAGIVRSLDAHVRSTIDEPTRLERHWEYGEGVFRTRWLDGASRWVGRGILTFVFSVLLGAVMTWAALRSGK